MTSAFDPLPSDLAAAHAMILAERAARVEAEAVAACAQAVNVSTGALIAHLKLEIEKLRRALYGSHSERKAPAAGADGTSAGRSGGGSDRGRVGGRESGSADADGTIVPAQAAFAQAVPRSSGARAYRHRRTRKLSLLRVDVETIMQPPAPFHVTPRGFAGPNLLAMILFEKFSQHQPLNRQSGAVSARRHRSERVDAGRPSRRLHDGSATATRADRAPCAGRRAAARRRHDRADPGQRQDGYGAHLDLRP